jgi:hypothetical protein
LAAAYFFFPEKKLGPNALGKTRSHVKASTSAASVGAAVGSGSALLPPIPDLSTTETDGITFLTPGETRKALREALKKHGESVAILTRLAAVPYQSFNNFMKASGEFGGNENQAYHPAATLAEKLRIATGKPKTKKRKALEAEMEVGAGNPRTGGPNLGLDPNGKYLVLPGAGLAKDSLGRYTISYR